MKKDLYFPIICLLFLLQSCEFNCSVGRKEAEKGKAEFKNGIRVSNDIAIEANGVQVEKAYLLFENGEAVPSGNIVDFSQPVKLILHIDKGWKEEKEKVFLGAAEKIESGNDVLLDAADLFEQYTDGLSAKDANVISLTATIRLREAIQPLTTFLVTFRIWDKKGGGEITGSYKLYSK